MGYPADPGRALDAGVHGGCAGSGTQEVPIECCLLMKQKGGEEAAPITWCLEEPYQATVTPLARGPDNAAGVSHVCASGMSRVDASSDKHMPDSGFESSLCRLAGPLALGELFSLSGLGFLICTTQIVIISISESCES